MISGNFIFLFTNFVIILENFQEIVQKMTHQGLKQVI